MMYTDNDFRLYHHGILGQKWGRRNGPPYPLDAPDHSASEKKAGWRKSLDKNDKESQNRRRLSDGQKKALAVGGTVLATALVAYGGYKLYQSGALDGVIGKGGHAIDDALPVNLADAQASQKAFVPSQKIRDVAEKTGFNLRKTIGSVSDDAKTANSMSYDKNATQWKNNCSHACMSYVLRRMGFDVEAEPMSEFETGGLMFSELGHYFKGLHPDHYVMPKVSTPDEAKRFLEKEIMDKCRGNELGATGLFELHYADSLGGGRHYCAWENSDGSIKFLDPQIHSDSADRYFVGLANGKLKRTIMVDRFDDLELRVNNLHEIAKNRT